MGTFLKVLLMDSTEIHEIKGITTICHALGRSRGIQRTGELAGGKGVNLLLLPHRISLTVSTAALDPQEPLFWHILCTGSLGCFPTHPALITLLQR